MAKAGRVVRVDDDAVKILIKVRMYTGLPYSKICKAALLFMDRNKDVKEVQKEITEFYGKESGK